MAEPTEEDMAFAWPAGVAEEPEMDVSLGRRRPLRARGPKQQTPREVPTLPIVERRKAKRPPPPEAAPAPHRTAADVVGELDRRSIQSERILRHLAEQTSSLARRLEDLERGIGDRLEQVGRAVARARRPVVAAQDAPSAVEELRALVDDQFLTQLTDRTAGMERRLDEVEKGLGSKLDRLGRSISTAKRQSSNDDAVIPALEKLHAAVDQLRQDVASTVTGIESRLSTESHGRQQQVKEALDRLDKNSRRVVSRDDLKQLWVEVAALVAQERSHVTAELERFSRELSERLERFTRRGIARAEPDRQMEDRLAVLLDTVELALRTAETSRQEILDGVAAAVRDELRKRTVAPLGTGLALPPGLQGVPGD